MDPIIGVFIKQAWCGDLAMECDREEFDATRFVQSMKLEDIIKLRDHREETDRIGQAHVLWEGPYEVEVVESIEEFFGVPITEITREMLDTKRLILEKSEHPKYAVTVKRIAVREKKIIVHALSFQDALRLAVEKAGNFHFDGSDEDATYEDATYEATEVKLA